jgi:uncharacterized peroxidase-related enzyme
MTEGATFETSGEVLTNLNAELRRSLNDPIFPDRLAQDYRRTGLDDRMMAIMDYVVQITRAPVETSEADIETLRGHGLSDDDIYDVIQTAAIHNFNNRVASAAGFIPDRRHHTAFRG